MKAFENVSKKPEISSVTFAEEEPAQKKRKGSSKEEEENIEWAAKESKTLEKDKMKNRKVKVEHLPVSVLEKIFSFLDWNDKGRALLVCQRWKTVGGNPFLWSEFPLHLADHNLDLVDHKLHLADHKLLHLADHKLHFADHNFHLADHKQYITSGAPQPCT